MLMCSKAFEDLVILRCFYSRGSFAQPILGNHVRCFYSIDASVQEVRVY